MRDRKNNSKSKDSDVLTPSVFDASWLPARERFEAMNDAYILENLILAPTRAVGHDVKTAATNWRFSDLSISRAFGHAHIGKVTRKASAKYMYIRKYYAGTFRVWSDGYYVHPKPGDIIVDASSDKLVFSVEDLQSCYINIPLDYLSIDIAPFQAPLVLPAETLASRLLSSAIEMWLTELPRTSVTELKILEASIVDLVSSVLLNRPQAEDGEALARVRSQAILHFVDEHLHDPDLSAGIIANTFHLSRASLFRRFEALGGVNGYIRTKRLEHALSLLTSEPAARGRVKDVAERVAFADPFHFSRSFKRTFGFSPDEAMALAPAPN